ncbi:hypothetical protein NUACC21_43560 [Scytonema sp. NUACC21]
MRKLKLYSLAIITTLFPVITWSQVGRAAVTSQEQVKEVAQWFSGSFNNARQIASDPSVPFISMSNCQVQSEPSSNDSETQNVYLEQKSTAFNRIRLYSFSPWDSAVKLNIRSFFNPDIASGICNYPAPLRVINISNLIATSCEVLLRLETESSYIGTNAPNGCPTASGGKVVSSVTVRADTINSLDQIFSASGTLLVSTPIKFDRISSIPEPSFIAGLVTLGIGYTIKTLLFNKYFSRKSNLTLSN